MKKIILQSISLLICSTISAQLKVTSNGDVRIQSPNIEANTMLAVGPFNGLFNDYRFALAIRRNPYSSYRTIGLYSRVLTPGYLDSGRAFGLFGVGGNATNGFNYGVVGTLCGNYNGAGIYGSSEDITGFVPGQYAGYFRGDTYVEGTLTAINVITPSDIRLKTNINETNNALYNLLKMNVISYCYKKHEIPVAERDTIQGATIKAYNKKWEADSKERHFGLSAQELQKVYPELVKEGQDGFLGINYVELVPILIKSIQELKTELDEVKGLSKAKTRSVSDEYDDFSGVGKDNILYQNSPNPFKGQTVIRFSLANNAQNAYICIYDMTGKQLRKFSLSSGDEQITINSYELGEGMFLYSLIVNGQEIDTKRMVISK